MDGDVAGGDGIARHGLGHELPGGLFSVRETIHATARRLKRSVTTHRER